MSGALRGAGAAVAAGEGWGRRGGLDCGVGPAACLGAGSPHLRAGAWWLWKKKEGEGAQAGNQRQKGEVVYDRVLLGWESQRVLVTGEKVESVRMAQASVWLAVCVQSPLGVHACVWTEGIAVFWAEGVPTAGRGRSQRTRGSL